MCKFLLNLISFPLLLIASANLAPILCICEVFSQLLKLYLCVKHKQRIKLVDNADCAFLVLRESSISVITFFMIFQGTVNLEEIKTAVKNKWTDVKLNGKYKHPLLREHIVDSCGYFFWLPNKNFSVDDHVQLYDCKPPKNQTEFDDLCSEISSEPLPESRSPWLVLVFPLDKSFGKEPRYVILLRLHHCLGDGYNLIQLISRCFLDERHNTFLSLKPKSAFRITTLLSCLFRYGEYAAGVLFKDLNILYGPPQTGKRCLRQLTLFSLPRVKKLAKATGATINDVMLSCVSGALKEFFSSKNAIPLRNVHCYVPVSTQSASDEVNFKNNKASLHVPLAVHGSTALVRLESTQQVSRRNKALPFYHLNYFVTKMVYNRIPAYISRLLMFLQDKTCIVSNVAFPQSQCFSFNRDKVLSFNVFPVHICKMGLGFVISSFNGNLQISVSADKSILEKKDVDNIIQSVIAEFEELEKSMIKEH